MEGVKEGRQEGPFRRGKGHGAEEEGDEQVETTQREFDERKVTEGGAADYFGMQEERGVAAPRDEDGGEGGKV